MSSNYRKPRIFLDYKENPATDLKTLKTLRKEGGHLVSGDVVIKDDGIFIQHNHKLRKITGLGEYIHIDKEYSGVTNDVMDYFSLVLQDAKISELGFSIEILTTDRTLLSLDERVRNRIIYATLGIETLTIEFSWGIKNSLISAAIPLNNIGEMQQSVSEMFCPYVTAVFVSSLNMYSVEVERSDCDMDYRIVSPDEKFAICDKEFIVRNGDFIALLTGPNVCVEKLVSSLTTSHESLTHVLTSDPESMIVFHRPTAADRLGIKIDYHRSRIWQRKDRHDMIVGVCLALYRLGIPNYVMLEIIDWLPNMQYHNHVKKIGLIFAVKESCEKVINSRS